MQVGAGRIVRDGRPPRCARTPAGARRRCRRRTCVPRQHLRGCAIACLVVLSRRPRQSVRATVELGHNPTPCLFEQKLVEAAQSEYGRVTGVLAAEPVPQPSRIPRGPRRPDGGSRWIVLDAHGRPHERHEEIRSVASIVALCELAGDLAGGGDGGVASGARAGAASRAPRSRAGRAAGVEARAYDRRAAAGRLARVPGRGRGGCFRRSSMRSGYRVAFLGRAPRRDRGRRGVRRATSSAGMRSTSGRKQPLGWPAWKAVDSGFRSGAIRRICCAASASRRAAGGVGAGGAARAVRDAHAEHRGRADRGGALPDRGRGRGDQQSIALRDAMRVLFPEAVALVSAARQGFMRER